MLLREKLKNGKWKSLYVFLFLIIIIIIIMQNQKTLCTYIYTIYTQH